MEGRSPLILPFPKGLNPFSLFQISLENFFDLKFRMWKEHGLDPDWIEKIPYYEYQLWIDKLNQAVEKENKEILEESGKKELFSFSK